MGEMKEPGSILMLMDSELGIEKEDGRGERPVIYVGENEEGFLVLPLSSSDGGKNRKKINIDDETSYYSLSIYKYLNENQILYAHQVESINYKDLEEIRTLIQKEHKLFEY